MNKTTRKSITGSMILLMGIMLFAVLGQAILVANAQTDVATVILLPSLGGTTDPAAGNYTYASNETFVLTATPDPGYTFQYWVVSGDYTPGHGAGQVAYIIDPDTGNIINSFPRSIATSTIDSLTFTTNPANISHGYGYTYVYQAVFAPTVAPTPTPVNGTTSNDTAIVIMEPTVGGTTSPATGTYAYVNGTNFVLTATPAAGYTFQYWVVNGNVTPGHLPAQVDVIFDDAGNVIAAIPRANTNATIDSLTFTANPANVSHGYGYTYAYTAVFAPTPVATPSPSSTVAPSASPTVAPTQTASPTSTPASSSGFPTIYVVAIVVVIIIIIIVAVAAVMMRRKK